MPRCGQLQIVFDRNNDLGDSSAGYAIFFGNLGLRLGLAIDDGKVTFGAHSRASGAGVLQGLKQADRRLITEGSGRMTAALLLLIVGPKGTKHLKRPPVHQRDLRG